VRITAKDVNNYLKTFGNFTTKYFRTWVANVTFIDQIMSNYSVGSDLSLTARKKIFRDCIKLTAEQLYHTPAICKKSYVSKELWTMFIEHPTKFDRIVARYYRANKLMDASENAFIHFLGDVC
jgi:DNA topoisomerase IB